MNKMDKCINNLKIYAEQVYFEGHIHMADDLADIVEYLESLPREPQEWIPCSERLPEYDYDTVLCITDTNFWAVMVYTKEHGFRSGDLDFNGEVIAWQPLPEPYKEE